MIELAAPITPLHFELPDIVLANISVDVQVAD
jgi:hypothetical protein